MLASVDYAIRCVTDAHEVLNVETDLSPSNPKVNAALSMLVRCLSKDYTTREESLILGNEKVKDIQERLLGKLAVAEGEMERYWTENFISRNGLSVNDLQSFWYWNNYDALVDGELACIAEKKPAFNNDESIAFVGSGALPLTAIMFHQKTGLPVTCIDRDPAACRHAARLLEKTKLSSGIHVECAEGQSYDYGRHDVVLIASLVPDKESVLNRIHETGKECVVGMRSVEHLHVLLYKPITEICENKNRRYIGKTEYNADIINTTLFFQAQPERAMPREGVGKRAFPFARNLQNALNAV